MTSDTISKNPKLKTSANDRSRCFTKVQIALEGSASTCQTRFNAACNCANTVVAPNNVKPVPMSNDQRLCSSLWVFAITVSASSAPSAPTRLLI